MRKEKEAKAEEEAREVRNQSLSQELARCVASARALSSLSNGHGGCFARS